MGLFFLEHFLTVLFYFLRPIESNSWNQTYNNYSTKWSWLVVDNNIPATITICSGANPARVAGKGYSAFE